MPGNSISASPAAPKTDPVLSWTVHLARRQPARLAVSVAVVLFASVCGYFAIGALAPVVIVIALISTLSEFLLPVTYVLTEQGAECRMLLKSASIRWESVRHCYTDGEGIKLTPLEYRSRLESFRGVYLRFAGNDAEVTSAVRALRERSCSE